MTHQEYLRIKRVATDKTFEAGAVPSFTKWAEWIWTPWGLFENPAWDGRTRWA